MVFIADAVIHRREATANVTNLCTLRCWSVSI